MDESFAKNVIPIIKEWLAEFKGLPESSIPDYAKDISSKEEIGNALIKLFSSGGSDENIIQPVCHQLFEFYRSGEKDLINFTINLFPSIICHHVVSAYAEDFTTPTDTLLLAVYTISSNESQEAVGLEIPQLGNPSIYHDPISGPFSDQMFDKKSTKKYFRKPYMPHHQAILPSNRYLILTQVLDRYFCNISLMTKQSLISLCDMCKFLASCGFPWQNKSLRQRRYPLSVDFMVKMLRCLYFALYNKCFADALKAAEAIDLRGKKELLPQVIFMCNAILNSVGDQTDAQEEASPYGLTSVNLTPLLSHELSKRKNRWAATVKSIRDHKWRHYNEEISGDLTRSVENSELQGTSTKPNHSQDNDEAKIDKHSTASPARIVKTKMKKSIGGAADKAKSPAPSTGDKKAKKGNDDQGSQERLKKSPSHHKELQPRYSSTSLQKHSSVDDASATVKTRSAVSISKSSSDVARSAASVKVSGTKGARNHSGSSTAPLIGQGEHDAKNDSAESDDKESYPLLPASETGSQEKSSVEQTAF